MRPGSCQGRILPGGLAAGLLLLSTVSAFGQATTREQADIGARAPTFQPAPLTEEAPVITEGAQPEAEAEAGAAVETFSFLLNGVNVANATAYDAEDFAELYGEFVGTDVTLGTLREIADRIEAKYAEDGYVATRVIVPPQAISDGTPTFEVYEGTIVYYEINGEIGPVKKQVARLLDNLITGKPARWSELERYLLLARDLPGISLTGTLRSAGDTAPGGVILVVDTARKATDAFINVQNLSSDSVGPETLSVGGALNSNTEYGERVGAVALVAIRDPYEQISGYLSYQQSLGGDGLVVKATGTQTFSEPGAELKPANLAEESTFLNLQLEYPVLRGRDFSLWTRGGFEYIDRHSSSGGNEIYDDQLRVLFGGLRGVWRPWGGGLSQFDVEFRQGLETFGAAIGPGRSRGDAVPGYRIVRGSLEHLQPFGPFYSIDLRAQGQYADVPVASVEEMTLGELTIGRGFDPGSVTGESGFGVAGEVRFSHPGFTNEVTAEYIDRVELYAFFDYGRLYDKGEPLGTKYEDVASWGVGVRIQALQTLFADFYIADPLEKGLSVEDDIPKRSVHFNVTKFF